MLFLLERSVLGATFPNGGQRFTDGARTGRSNIEAVSGKDREDGVLDYYGWEQEVIGPDKRQQQQ